MKEVFHISLQGISFKMEQDAYYMLEEYLQELKEHYGKQEEEVVNDIEERIAELLLERGCSNQTVVQLDHIEEIIRILGRPSEIDDSTDALAEKVKKGIFRDTSNGIVAGVCSGLGAYFNMDAVWVRIIFILLAVVFTAPSLVIRNFLGINVSWFGFMLLIYAVLWIIIPEAKTVSQRCAMRGESQRVDHIHKRFAQGARTVGSEMWQVGSKATGSVVSTIWRIIRFAVGAFFTAIGFGGIVMLGVIFFGVDVLAGISLFSVPDFIELDINSTVWLKVFGTLSFLLPCVGMLYGGMQLCFNFKSPKWRPGLVIFLVWLTSALIFTLSMLKGFSPYYDIYSDTQQEISVPVQKDTLYVMCEKLPDMEKGRMNLKARYNTLELFYLNKEDKKNVKISVYPNFHVKRIIGIEPKIEVSMLGDSDIKEVVTVTDSLITIHPALYSKKNKFAGQLQSLKLYVPDSITVILKEPVEFTFGSYNGYNTGIYR